MQKRNTKGEEEFAPLIVRKTGLENQWKEEWNDRETEREREKSRVNAPRLWGHRFLFLSITCIIQWFFTDIHPRVYPTLTIGYVHGINTSRLLSTHVLQRIGKKYQFLCRRCEGSFSHSVGIIIFVCSGRASLLKLFKVVKCVGIKVRRQNQFWKILGPIFVSLI